MPELATDFQSLPEEYQLVICLAEETHKIAVAPLQLLVGGWSGAVVYLVSVSNNETKRVEHCILKLDRKGNSAKSDEVTRHNTLIRQPHLCSVPQRSTQYVAEELRNCPGQRRSRIGTRRDLRVPHLECGWLLPPWCRLGQHWGIEEGLALTDQGLKVYRGLKTPPVFWPLLLHLCAGAYGSASQPKDGLPMLDEAMAAENFSTGSSESLAPHFLSLKGDFLLALSSDNAVAAESLYQDALNSAREVGAAMVELQAAMRLSRLWQNQGKSEQARELLNAAYSKITEGFTTADMKEANALLAALSS